MTKGLVRSTFLTSRLVLVRAVRVTLLLAAITINCKVFAQVSQPLIETPAFKQESAAPSGDWRFSNSLHAAYRILGSSEAQHGKHLVEIDTSEIEFPIDYRGRYSSYPQETNPRGFLYQTISAERFIGQHLHISLFAKSVMPNFAEIEKRFEQYFLEEQETRFAEDYERRLRARLDRGGEPKKDWDDLLAKSRELEFSAFAIYLRELHATANFGVSVLLHLGPDPSGAPVITEYTPTSRATPRQNELWNRFNIEVGIPEQCEAISIVLWSKGLNVVQYDHVAVVPHGDVLEGQRRKYGLSEHAEIVKAVSPLVTELNTQFKNISFEE